MSEIGIKISADSSNVRSQADTAKASIQGMSASARTEARAMSDEFERLNATLKNMQAQLQQTSANTGTLRSFAEWNAALAIVKTGWDGVTGAARLGAAAFNAVDQGEASLRASFQSGVQSFREYAESLVYVAAYLPLVKVQNEGLAATLLRPIEMFGKLSAAIREYQRNLELGRSGALDTVGPAIAAAGAMGRFASEAKRGGFDSASEAIVNYTRELMRIKDMTPEVAASIESGFASIPGYTAEMNRSLLDYVAEMAVTKDKAKELSDTLTAAMTDPAASGEAFLSGQKDISAELLNQFDAAKRANDVGAMRLAILTELNRKEVEGLDEISRKLREQEAVYKEMGFLGESGLRHIHDQIVENDKAKAALAAQLAVHEANAHKIAETEQGFNAAALAARGIVNALNPAALQLDALNGKIATLTAGLAALGQSGGAALNGPATGNAADIIKREEGFLAKAKIDSDGKYRDGFGSDTHTAPDGTHSAVTADSTTTREDAERDLARRVVEFQAEAASQIGAAWAGLSDKAKASITSVTYNYGHVPASLVAAARSGSDQQIAGAIGGLTANPDRRRREAANITSGGDATTIDATNQALAKEKDARQAVADAARGGTAADLAQIAILERAAAGKKDEVQDAKDVVAARMKMLEQANSEAEKTKARVALAQAEVTLNEKKLEVQKAQAALNVANAGDKDDKAVRDAKISQAKLSMGDNKGTAQYIAGLAQIKAAEDEFDKAEKAKKVAAEDESFKIKLAGVEKEKQVLQLKAANGDIDKAQMLAAEKGVSEKSVQIQREHYDVLKGLEDKDTTEYAAAAEKRLDVDRKISAEQSKLAIQTAQQIQQSYKGVANQIGGTMTSSIMGMIQGTTTFKQMMQKIMLDVVQMFVKAGVDMVASWAATQAKNVVVAVTGQSQITLATVLGSAQRSAAAAAGAAASIAPEKAAAAASVATDSGRAGAGVAAFLAPLIGPAAIPAGAAAAAETAAIGAFDVGAWNIPNDQLAMVHKGELVMTASQGEAFRSTLNAATNNPAAPAASSGAGNHTHNWNVSAVDPAGVRNFFANNSRALAKGLDRAIRNGDHLGLKRLGTT